MSSGKKNSVCHYKSSDVFVFELVNPFREKQKDGLKGNASSFKVYEQIDRLEKFFPKRFKHIPGNVFREGGNANKAGYIVCTIDVVATAKTCIEMIDLPEGHYKLKLLIIPKKLIDKLKALFGLKLE